MTNDVPLSPPILIIRIPNFTIDQISIQSVKIADLFDQDYIVSY